jgi:hypothetical protein
MRSEAPCHSRNHKCNLCPDRHRHRCNSSIRILAHSMCFSLLYWSWWVYPWRVRVAWLLGEDSTHESEQPAMYLTALPHRFKANVRWLEQRAYRNGCVHDLTVQELNGALGIARVTQTVGNYNDRGSSLIQFGQ